MDADTLGCVYLLHFSEPFHHAQHYLGWTNNLDKRLAEHRKGARQKCVLTDEIKRHGIPWRLVRTWEKVPLAFEKQLKRQKNGRRLCPICNPKQGST